MFEQKAQKKNGNHAVLFTVRRFAMSKEKEIYNHNQFIKTYMFLQHILFRRFGTCL